MDQGAKTGRVGRTGRGLQNILHFKSALGPLRLILFLCQLFFFEGSSVYSYNGCMIWEEAAN